MPPFLANLLKNTKALVAIGVALGLVILVAVIYGKFNSAQKTMVAKETRLSSQYNDCQNNLSSYVAQIKEALGVADRATDALDRVLTDAVKGRYEGDTSAQPGGGALFSAITEAYPDLSGMTVNYENVQSAIFAGRDGFKNCQTQVLDLVRDYNDWRNAGLVQSKINAMVGAPSENLEASIGDDTVTGAEALTRIKRIVLTSDAKQSYETGIDEGIDTNPAAPAPTTAP